MTLKELYENYSGEEIKNILLDYLTLPPAYRARYTFEDYIADFVICDKK